ncbi:MAG: type II secretion system GspH family protein [Candidatus Omnitrophica bacterium]|nr:type II secretion system GspH family protein [Candidatus Omnitrophota bacterium]MBU1996220.1 type II secretion system GspH family protein [Candidatus Omnitrophota bacterium]MBU4333598.1 type II secretion system GspH family protein [Candidatus Omnitrophota bacterium]
MSIGKNKKCYGFTLAEITVVIVIIGFMAALALPRLSAFSRKIKNQEAEMVLLHIYDAQIDYNREVGNYANNVASLAEVSVPALKGFKDLTISDSSTIACAAGTNTAELYLARFTANDDSYMIYVLENNARMVCTPCDSVICTSGGYQTW